MKLVIVMIIAVLFGSIVASSSFKEDGKKTDDESVSYGSHVELGDVHWLRDFAKAKQVADSKQRPLFVLFQEIPGCQTCQDFGKQPLSHPLIVEAVEDQFVPVTIFNNQPGVDAQLLKKFGEPSWNNPVIRFMTSSESDIVSRKDRVWSTDAVAGRINEALEQAGKPVPEYMKMVTLPDQVETAEFAMHCYWEGEVRLGSIPGVYTTRSGWRNSLEVVQVKYDPKVVSYDKLLETAVQMECASKVFAHTNTQLKIAKAKVGSKAEQAIGKMRDAKASDQKYYLTKTPMRHLPLTEIQATKLNAIGRSRKSPEPLLSPRQRKLLKQSVSASPDNRAALKSLQFPENQNQLGDYQKKLQQTLDR